MPYYEYSCPECEEMLLLLRGVLERDDLPECGKCGAKMPRKVSAPGTFIFKGAGFHQVDYPSKRS